jgi:hypothetical protein
MRGAARLSVLLVAGMLSGCGALDWLDGDPDALKLGAMVREEVERVEAERGSVRGNYIDQRIQKKIDEIGQNLDRVLLIEEKIGALGTRVDSLARRTVKPRMALSVDDPSGPTLAQLDALRGETEAAIRAVSDLIEMTGQQDAEMNARFERLERRTRQVAWPDVEPGTAHGLHLASYRTHASALRGWEVLLRKYPAALKGQESVLVEADTVAGRFVRLFAGAGLPETSLVRLRDLIRAGGDYAMIMLILRQGAHARGSRMKKIAPGS